MPEQDDSEQITPLQAVLARLAPVIVNDREAERTVEIGRQAAAQERQGRVADMLRREHVDLTPDVYPEILRVGPAQKGRLNLRSSTSLTWTQAWLTGRDVPATLVLSGGTGCGKSVAAAYAMAWVLHSCRWRSAMNLARLFAANFGDQLEEQERCCNCRLLVVDDAGLETDHPRFHMALLELLERRGKNPRSRRTLLTTNLRKTEFLALYGDPRLDSRFDPSLVGWIEDAGPDLRKRGRL